MTIRHETITLESTTCITCGVVYAFPVQLMDFHKSHGKTHYCPNGHPQMFVDPEVPRLEKQLRNATERMRQAEYQLDGTLRKLGESNKELKRIKRRVRAGVCLHCKRHFVNLERHVESKHKEESK